MKIGIFGKKLNIADFAWLQKLVDELYNENIAIVFHEGFYDQISHKVKFKEKPELFSETEDIRSRFDFLFSLGGDGTLLKTIDFIKNTGIPILGINLGNLGFLTTIGKNDIPGFLADLKHQKYDIEERSLLHVKEEGGVFLPVNFAMNELCLQRKNAMSMLSVDVFVNDKFLTNYTADGLLVATPTGSTAYSLSCGGPILAPNSNCFVLTPIAAHTLTLRPIIIPDDSEIRISVKPRQTLYASLDGRKKIPAGKDLLVKKENFTIKLIRMNGQDFYESIRKKLMWGKKAERNG